MSDDSPMLDIEDVLATALCAHYAKTRIISKGHIIEHLSEGEETPCQSCVAASRAVAANVWEQVEAAVAEALRDWFQVCETYGLPRPWSASDLIAAAEKRGAEAVVAAVEGLFACRCRDEAERECRDHGDGAAAFFTKAYEDAARAAASALDDLSVTPTSQGGTSA